MTTFRFLLFLLPLALLAACSDDDNGTNPPAGDTEKPFVSFITPTSNQVVTGDVLDVELNATDNVKVTRIELKLNMDLSPVQTLTQAPWTTTIDISALPPGVNSITAKAYDSAGNASNLATVAFERTVEGAFRFQFVNGAEFTYDRWDLLDGNLKDESSRRTYTSRFEKGVGLIGDKAEWYRMMSTDAMSGRTDTMIAHVDGHYNIQVYGLANELVRRFTRPLIEQGFLTGPPELPEPVWSYLVKVNDENGNGVDPGEEWDLTPAGGIALPLGLINATVTMKAQYVAKGEVITVNGKEITTWEMLITVTIDILGNTSDIPVHLWFSDDPSGQIQLQQDATLVTVPIIGTVPVPGDRQELLSWK
ncbi:MAG: Ig-like domain-containing protein [Bacteroidota bacterium]|jgi:hypothetical protein|nr:Ig-like domain-containing protein [Bacteroidota bacterium]